MSTTVRRVLAALAALIVLAVGALLLVPVLFKDTITARVSEEASRQLRADVRFDGVEVTALQDFPDVTVGLTGVSVVNREAPFEGVRLAEVGELRLALDVMSVVSGGTIEVKSFRLADATLNAIIDEEGRSNLDLGPESEDDAEDDAEDEEGSSAFALSLDGYTIENLDLSYDDRQAGTLLVMKDLDHQGSGDLTAAKAALETRTDIAALSVRDGGVDYLKSVKVGWDLDVELEQDAGRVTLRENRLTLNALTLVATGTVVQSGDDLDLDLTFESPEAAFRDILSLIPAVYSAEYASMVSAGTLALKGSVKGRLVDGSEDLPAFNLDLSIADGSFSYPDLPTSVGGVAVQASIQHPGGDPDKVVVDVPRFRMALDGSPIEGSLRVLNPVSDPDVALRAVGTLDLGRLQQAVPLEAGARMSGTLDMDVDVAGRVSQFESEDLDAVKAAGTFALSGFTYEGPEVPLPVQISQMSMTLAPKQVEVSKLQLRIGDSDIGLTARLDNLLAYAMTDAPLSGQVEMTSKLLDLDALAGDSEEEEAAADSGESAIYIIPDNLDLALSTRIDKLRYDEKVYQAVNGRVSLRGGAMDIEELSMKFLGGTVGLTGSYSASSARKADVDMKVDLKNIGVSEAAKDISTLARAIPAIEKASGRISGGMSLVTSLGPDLTPDLATLLSLGSFRASDLTVNPAAIQKIGETLKNDTLSKLVLDGSDLGFEVRNGRIKVEPTAVKLGKTRATLQGTTGTLDQTLDLQLDLSLPAGDIGAADLLKGLGAVGAAVGDVDLLVLIGGTFSKPTVSVKPGSDLKGAVDEVIEEVKDKVVDAAMDLAGDLIDEAKKKGDQLVDEAKKAADAVRAAAKTSADKLRSEASKQADKLKKEAKGNPVKEAVAKEAAKKVESEADKAAKKLESEADTQAKKLVDTAKSQRDKLIAEAEAKTGTGGSGRSR